MIDAFIINIRLDGDKVMFWGLLCDNYNTDNVL